MIERARLPRRRKRNPVRYYLLSALQWVLIFGLVFYYASFISRQPKVRIVDVSVDGAHALDSDAIAKIASAPFSENFAKYIRRDNSFLYPKLRVQDEVLAYDRRISAASVAISGHAIKVSIQEWEPVFRYCVPPVGYSSGRFASSTALDLPTKILHASTTPDSPLNASTTPTGVVIDLSAGGLRSLPDQQIATSEEPSCYWVNSDGMAFARSPHYSGSPLLTFVEGDPAKFEGAASSTPPLIGTVVLDDKIRSWGTQMQSELLLSGSMVYNYEVLPLGDIIIKTGRPYSILASVRNKPSDESRLFMTAQTQFDKKSLDTPKEYLDLREIKKIYYR